MENIKGPKKHTEKLGKNTHTQTCFCSLPLWCKYHQLKAFYKDFCIKLP